MGVSQLRQPRPGEDVGGQADLRLHRDTVLEPGTDAGNQGQGVALVRAVVDNHGVRAVPVNGNRPVTICVGVSVNCTPGLITVVIGRGLL